LVRHQFFRSAQSYGMEFQHDQATDQRLGKRAVLPQGCGDILKHGQISEQGAILQQDADALSELLQ
jgi:hypothetical protein